MKIERIDWPIQWDIGASNLTTSFDLDTDELNVTYRIAPADAQTDNEFATIIFSNCQSFKFLKHRFDLEALKQHKYYSLGLEHLEAHKVYSSDWLKEFKTLNPGDIDRNLNHYILSFKDELLEVLAGNFKVADRFKKRKRRSFNI